ncbi:MAG: hypothetical protein ACWIPI_03600 [Polaribacter sp.]
MKYFILFLVSICVISCGNKQDTTDVKKPKPLMSIIATHKSAEKVDSIFTKEVENWQELKVIDSFLVKFRKISPNEALSNALELRDLVKSLKDSVKPKIFETPSFNARINILYNETLRLADITLISAIKATEVNKEVDKNIAAFSAVNEKINTVFSKKKFEDEININLLSIGLDSTKIDSISRKSINLKKKQKLKKPIFLKER